MSFDDELSKRMKKAAEQAGSEADSAAAASNVAGAISAAGGGSSIGLVGVLAIVGLVVGAVFGATLFRQSANAADSDSTPSMSFLEVAVYDCPNGDLVRVLHPGDRVFVIGENPSGDWAAFRDPDNTSRTLWLPDPALGRDSDPDLPVILCDEDATQTDTDVAGSSTTTPTDSSTSSTSVPESSTSSSTSSSTTSPTTTAPGASSTAPEVTTPPPATTSGPNATTPPTSPPTTPTTSPSTTPSTSPPTTPPPTIATTTTTTQPPDTTKPILSSASASETWIFTNPCGGTVTSSALSVVATDNVGVVSVQATYGSGLPGSPINMSRQGNTWSGTFGTFAAPGSSDLIAITLTARDAAGNSASTGLVIDLDWCFG